MSPKRPHRASPVHESPALQTGRLYTDIHGNATTNITSCVGIALHVCNSVCQSVTALHTQQYVCASMTLCTNSPVSSRRVQPGPPPWSKETDPIHPRAQPIVAHTPDRARATSMTSGDQASPVHESPTSDPGRMYTDIHGGKPNVGRSCVPIMRTCVPMYVCHTSMRMLYACKLNGVRRFAGRFHKGASSLEYPLGRRYKYQWKSRANSKSHGQKISMGAIGRQLAAWVGVGSRG
jgi:hypothetical protein